MIRFDSIIYRTSAVNAFQDLCWVCVYLLFLDIKSCFPLFFTDFNFVIQHLAVVLGQLRTIDCLASIIWIVLHKCSVQIVSSSSDLLFELIWSSFYALFIICLCLFRAQWIDKSIVIVNKQGITRSKLESSLFTDWSSLFKVDSSLLNVIQRTKFNVILNYWYHPL